MRLLRNLSICALFLSAAIAAGQTKPDFSGRWELDLAASSFARQPAPQSQVDVIEHQEAAFVLSSTTGDARGTQTMNVKWTNDGREVLNVVNGNQFRASSKWEGSKLVTLVIGDRGLSLTEVRWLSPDKTTLTVETYIGGRQGEPDSRKVLRRQTAQ